MFILPQMNQTNVMKNFKLGLAAMTAVLGFVATTYAQQTILSEAAITSGGTTTDYPNSGPPGETIGPVTTPGVDVSSLNLSTGIGTMTYTSTALGPQYFGLFYDIDNDLVHSTAFYDQASESGTPFTGESWEIGDSGGATLYNDAANNTLQDANTMSSSPGDVAFGLGVNFDNSVAGTETITIHSTLTAPSSGFYVDLEQENTQDIGTTNDQPNYLYATASFTPEGVSPTTPDGGSTLSALAMGVMALAGLKSRFARK
jgi:hypothetical protein